MRFGLRRETESMDAHLPRGYRPPHSLEMAEGLALLGAREGVGHVEIVAHEVQVELVVEEQQ